MVLSCGIIYISLLVESIQTPGEELIAIVIWLGSHSIPMLMESHLRSNASVIVCPYLAMHVFSPDPRNGLFNATVDNALEFSINYLSSCWELKMCNFPINTHDRIGLFPLYKSVSSIFICSLKCTKFSTVVNAECMQCQFSIWNSVNNRERYSL